MFTIFQGGVWVVGVATAVYVLFALRFLVGLAEAPSFPANGRIVAAWFPANERGSASAIFNSAQYFATVIFAPIMGFSIAFNAVVETFLAQHLGGHAEPIGDAFSGSTIKFEAGRDLIRGIE